MEEENEINQEEIKFKPIKKKPLRRRHSSSSESEGSVEDTELLTKVEEMKVIQKLRRRPNGVSVAGLTTGQKMTIEEELICKDPFKVKSGGMVNMKALKSCKEKPVDDAYETSIGTQFSAETNKRDEDDEMMKYIEEQLAKRKGDDDPNKDSLDASRYLSPEEAALQALPEHLRHSSTNKSEEMLSNQMLSGIPEVDLGIEAKIKNIEATEEAKLKLLWDKRNKQEGPSQFVPTNMAVNFVQHNRFNMDVEAPRKRKSKMEEVEEKQPAGVSETTKQTKKEKGEKATDDYHYEKFKKQFRRY